jgi:peptidoglycan/xylan/chitin deacetylase (PgdA/CDA1 family)
MRHFHVCIHDATPAYARETELMLRDLAPLVGSRLSLGVVPDWHGAWPLTMHAAYCRLIKEGSGELLLHGYFHQRRRGSGLASWIAERSDEMNGLNRGETLRALEQGQRVLAEVFGKPARGFLAPAWQRGHAHDVNVHALGIEHMLGYFALESCTGRRIPLATYTWDCGRWGWLGHVGHGLGRLLQIQDRRVPVVAIHPRDVARGFWPQILRLIEELLEQGYQPRTLAALLQASDVEVRI